MKRLLAAAAFAALPVWAGAPAWGQTLDEARAAAAGGRFLEAAEIGTAAGGSDGYALAADVLAVYGFHLAAEDERREIFARAMAAAEEAIRRDADNAEAHMQSAHAMGRYAQAIGSMAAFAEGFAERIEAALDTALALDPNHARAHLALAGWHAGIVDAAGGFMARTLYGATESAALEHYERALALAPGSVVVRFDYAENLLALDDEYEGRARELLAEALALPPADAYGELVRARARALLAEVDKG